MKNKKKFGKLIGILAVITVAGFTTFALADQSTTGTQYNQGSQGRQMGSGGQGWGHRGSNWDDRSGGGQGNMGNMSAEDMQKMQQERDAFLKETEGLRQDLYNNDLELRNELGKQDPDDRKVAGLQKEISQLETQLYQKRDEYMVRMQKINPNAGRGYMRGGGMKSSGGSRGMMGPGGGQGRMGTGGNNRW
jgi:zinc resistance-associated protein